MNLDRTVASHYSFNFTALNWANQHLIMSSLGLQARHFLSPPVLPKTQISSKRAIAFITCVHLIKMIHWLMLKIGHALNRTFYLTGIVFNFCFFTNHMHFSFTLFFPPGIYRTDYFLGSIFKGLIFFFSTPSSLFLLHASGGRLANRFFPNA